MIFNLICWLVLAFSGASVGFWLLALVKDQAVVATDDGHRGDRVIVAIWLGLLTIASALLAVSLIMPLTPAVGFAVFVVLTCCAFASPSVRAEFRGLAFAASTILAVALLVLVTALGATRMVEAYDTGLYHYPLAHWLAAYGTVKGLALIHFRFGFSSSWFALAAPFDGGPFQARAAGMLDSLAALLAVTHFGMAVSRILAGRSTRADWFLAGGYAFILAACFAWAFDVSLSPDVPVWILTLLTGWLMVRASESDVAVRINPLVVLLVACGTITLKPSALPVAGVAAIFYWLNSRYGWRSRLLAGAAAGVIALPVFAVNYATSGCPVYPSSMLCAEAPWGVGKAGAKVIAAGIEDWGRWRDAAHGTDGSWMRSWITQPDKLFIFGLCGLCVLGFVALRGWRAGKGSLYALGLALLGTAFLLGSAPNPRFGIGYFALYPAVLAVAFCPSIEGFLHPRGAAGYFSQPRAAFLTFTALAVVLGLNVAVRERAMRRTVAASGLVWPADAGFRARLLLPPRLPSASGDLAFTKNRKLNRADRMELTEQRVNGVAYYSPNGRDQCWGAAIPCVPMAPESEVQLRGTAAGFRGGFVRSSLATLPK
jgi:hypothetical protein